MKQSRSGQPAALPRRTAWLTQLRRQPVCDRLGQLLGQLIDVVAESSDGPDLPVAGLLVGLDNHEVFVPATAARLLQDFVEIDPINLSDKPFHRSPTDLLLAADVLGHRLLDVRLARLVRARDVELTLRDGRWMVAGVDVEWGGWWHRLKGRFNGRRAHRSWDALEPLTNTKIGPVVGRPEPGLARLKVAQIADLLEHASEAEQVDILADLGADPELEADVFEELDRDHNARLLTRRADAEVAGVLARMRPDTAADAIATLPHDRLVKVLNLLPAHQRVKLSVLLGYNPATAGGLMGVDFVAVDDNCDAKHALDAVAEAADVEPQALSSVYLLNEEARLSGSVTLAELVQAPHHTPVAELADRNPVCVPPEADSTQVALLMCDHNLLSLPVTDPQHHLVGLITVDDVLDTTIPIAWRRRMGTSATPFAPPEAS